MTERRDGMRLRATLLAAAAAVVLLPSAISAQPGGPDQRARLTELFADMSVDTGVRVVTPQLFIDHGWYQSVGPEAVRIQYAGEVVPVNLGDIRSLQVEGRHPVQGTLWGLGSGLLVGAVGGLLVASFFCDDPVDCDSEERRGAILGGSLLGGAGAISGFLIGRYQVSWRQIFP